MEISGGKGVNEFIEIQVEMLERRACRRDKRCHEWDRWLINERVIGPIAFKVARAESRVPRFLSLTHIVVFSDV